MPYSLNVEEGRTNQENAIYGDTTSKVVHTNKLENGVKHYYRLFPFNEETMNAIGIAKPLFEVKKYMFDSAVDFRDDANTQPQKVVTTSEATIGETDTFAEHIKMRIAEMQANGNVDGLNAHNALFTGKYSRQSPAISPEYPLMPHEFGIMECWVAALPVEEKLVNGKSVPAADAAVILNIKRTGKSQIFGRKGKKPLVGLLETVGSDLFNQEDGYDIVVTRNSDNYHYTDRRKTSSIEDDSLYLDANLPNAVEEVRGNINSEEAIRQYDLAIGYKAPEKSAETAKATESEESVKSSSITEGIV